MIDLGIPCTQRRTHIIQHIHKLVVRCTLDNHNLSVWFAGVHYAGHFAEGLLEVVDIVQDPHGDEGVKGVVRMGDLFSGSRSDVDLGIGVCLLEGLPVCVGLDGVGLYSTLGKGYWDYFLSC